MVGQNNGIQQAIQTALEYKRQNNFDLVSSIYTQLIALQHDNPDFYDELAQSQAQRGLFAEAINNYQKAIELGKINPFWTYKNLGDAFKQESRLNEAISVYQKAITLDSNNPITYESLGQAQALSGNFNAAIINYQKALELGIKNPLWTYINLGDTLIKENRLNEARSAYQQVLKLQPDNSLVATKLKEIGIQQQNEISDNSWLEIHNQGDEYFKQEEWEKAIAFYQQAIELNPDYFWSHYNLGRALSELKKWDEAIVYFKKTIALKPSNQLIIDIYQRLGGLFEEVNQYDEAVISYHKVIELNPTSPWAYRGMGNVLLKQKKLEEAVTSYQKSIELKYDEYHSHEMLGLVLEQQGKLPEAIAAYRIALQLEPNQNTIQLKLSALEQKATQIVGRENRLEETNSTEREALKFQPNNSSVTTQAEEDEKKSPNETIDNKWLEIHNRGDKCFQQEKWEGAIAFYQQEIELHPEDANLYRELGVAQERIGDIEGEIKSYQKAIELDTQQPIWVYTTLNNLLQEQVVLAEPPQKDSYVAQKPIVLFTPYYKAKSVERQNEYIYCLLKNIQCNAIEKIVLIIDDGHQPELDSPKIEIISISSRPSYLDWIKLTEEKCKNKISILANTDIYFDESITKLREIFIADPKAFIALTRYEKEGLNQILHKNSHWSQDVWAVSGEHDFSESFKKYLGISLGVPRCDNKIAYVFAINGKKVYNPCNFVKTVHVHETQIRNYDKKHDTSILGGVAYVHPNSNILDYSKLDIDLWAVDFSQIKKVKLNKALEIWAKEKDEALKDSLLISKKDTEKTYKPKVDCILFPIIKSEIDDIINYFDNILLPTKVKESLTIVISIDRVWEDEDKRKIQDAIQKSRAKQCIKEIKFISCELTESESIYVRELPEKLWELRKMEIPSHGLKTGPNLQFLRSLHNLLSHHNKINSVLLQEADTIPLKKFWIDRINEDIEKCDDALLIGTTYSGVSELKPEQINHINGNAIYCLGNSLFKNFLRLWEQLIIEVCKKAPWKAYDTATEWAIKYMNDDSCWVVDNKKREDSPYFSSTEIKEYLDMYNNKVYKLNQLVNKAGPVELKPETVFEPTSIATELQSASVIHLRPALPFRDLCRYVSNQKEFIESNVIGHDALWQDSLATEKQAYEIAKQCIKCEDDSIVYFGFPWGTLIDQLVQSSEKSQKLLSVLGIYKPYLKDFSRVVTVCQHDRVLEFQNLFHEAGITDIFWSNKVNNQNTLPNFKEIKIYPFPLFSVQGKNTSNTFSQQLTEEFIHIFFEFVRDNIHLKAALPFRDICTYISNKQKFIESNVIGHDALWQYPAITEQHAYLMAKKYLKGYDKSITYFGFPWATLLDQFLHNKQDTKHLLAVLESYKPYLKQFDKVVTVCQHIYMLKFQHLFSDLNIHEVFWSHAVKNQDHFPEFPNISIHPFPLFPVQALGNDLNKLKWKFRKFLFCFVGSKSPSYYLSNSRNQIIEYLGSDPRGFVRSRNTWHYSDIVYKYQIRKAIAPDKDLMDKSAAIEFKEVLKQSVFSLCPSGSGPNSIRLWESIGCGAIPVVLADTYLPPGDLELWEKGVIVCPETTKDIKSLPDKLIELNKDKEFIKNKKDALETIWSRYGSTYFIYDIKRFFDKYLNIEKYQ